jgi:hypothetical protein
MLFPLDARLRPLVFATLSLGGAACASLVDLGPPREFVDDGSGGGGDIGGGGSGGTAAGGEAPVCPGPGPVVAARNYGDASAQYGGQLVVDGRGGLYVAGTFAGALDFGGGSILVSQGGQDEYVAHLDGRGVALWTKRFGDADEQLLSPRLAPTIDGGVAVANEVLATTDLGDGPVTTDGIDGYVVVYDELGDHRWSRWFGGAGRQSVLNLAVDPSSGAIFALGSFEGSMDLDGEVVTSAGLMDVFLVKLDPNTGEVIWHATFGGPLDDWGNGLSVDSTGRVAFGGETHNALDLGLGLISDDDADQAAFIALYDSSLTPLWADIYHGPGKQDLRRIVFDDTRDELVVAGVLQGSMTIGESALVTSSGSFFARLALADGTSTASRAYPGFQHPSALALDPQGDLVVAGSVFTSADIGDQTIVSKGGRDGLIVKLDVELAPRWAFTVGSDDTDNLQGVGVDVAGRVFAQGFFHGTLDIPGCPSLPSAGDSDTLILELAP